jgi:hypothetical protein
MITLSSLIAAPAFCFAHAASIAPTYEVRSRSRMYHLVSVNSAEINPVDVRGFVTAGRRFADPRNGSDFPVSGQYQFAGKGAGKNVSDRSDPH